MKKIPIPIPVKKRTPLEVHVENHLRKKILALGGECYKWCSPNNRGVPDRVVVLPGGRVWFVELKRDASCKLSPKQELFMQRMDDLEVRNVITLYGKDDVDAFVLGLTGE
jgi:hypothetical protein